MKYQAQKYTPRKTEALTALTDLVSKAKSIAVVDYTKMTPSQATELRRSVHKAGGEMKVAKNTLLRLALQRANSQFSISNSQLTGLNAFIFALTDEISPLKVIADYIKKNNVLAFRAGFQGEKVLSAIEVEQLARTPSRETSIVKILYLLNWNTSKLVRTLDAVVKKG